MDKIIRELEIDSTRVYSNGWWSERREVVQVWAYPEEDEWDLAGGLIEAGDGVTHYFSEERYYIPPAEMDAAQAAGVYCTHVQVESAKWLYAEEN